MTTNSYKESSHDSGEQVEVYGRQVDKLGEMTMTALDEQEVSQDCKFTSSSANPTQWPRQVACA